MACSAKHEVYGCTTSGAPAFFYALITDICTPPAASFQASWVVLGLYVGVLFTFSLIFHFSISWFYSFLDGFVTFWAYLLHPGKAGKFICLKPV